jgi:bisanhydrobacterioruberin hydratase
MSIEHFQIVRSIANRKKETAIFFIVFYIVGILGISFEFSNPFFLKLIPFALLLSFTGLVFFHASTTDFKTILVFAGIYFTGFLIEAIGVNSGKIFGAYQYGDSLGFKIAETPLIIGINWLFLVYASSSVLERFKIKSIYKIFIASGIMLVYDFVLEQLAPQIDMWHWKNEWVPFQNYIAWFVISIVFHSLIKVFKINTMNRMAGIILACQFLFFVGLFFI